VSAEPKWEDTRWYRVLDVDGDEYCETSDRGEAANALDDAEGGKLQRLQERREFRWVDIEPRAAS